MKTKNEVKREEENKLREKERRGVDEDRRGSKQQ